MCVIVYVPQGQPLPDMEILNNCWDNNDDGGGVMYVNPNYGVEIDKHLDKNTYISRLISIHKEYGHISPIIAHFRVGTCGGVNLYNTHPFVIQERKLAYCHNGQIFSVPKDSPVSDSHLFALKMRTLPSGFLNSSVPELLRIFAAGDKLVFLDDKKKVTIINEASGEWNNGVWFSNYTYRTSRYKSWHGTRYEEIWGYSDFYGEAMGYLPRSHTLPDMKCDWCEDRVHIEEIKRIDEGGLWLCKGCLQMLRREKDPIFINGTDICLMTDDTFNGLFK